jgi:hypothetical protein
MQGFPLQPELVTHDDGGDERGRRKGCEKMKYSRIAAIVAGSVVAMGAAPAFAASTAPMPPMSLNGGLETLGSASALDLTDGRSTVNSVADTATDLNSVKGATPQQALKTAAEVTPLLGGVELGG